METAIGSLHQAIEVLSGAGTGGDMGLLSVAAKAPLQAAGRGRMHVFFPSHALRRPESKRGVTKKRVLTKSG